MDCLDNLFQHTECQRIRILTVVLVVLSDPEFEPIVVDMYKDNLKSVSQSILQAGSGLCLNLLQIGAKVVQICRMPDPAHIGVEQVSSQVRFILYLDRILISCVDQKTSNVTIGIPGDNHRACVTVKLRHVT